ncbi:MAG TPA: tRNA uridine-5-carboxymethylaminomethyl(34) synthesis GTPase MnmE [Candidatus Baltobacteraceae bacterium]|nr:tRNA uridine-5-carboxymethylaminomethyl(34) synthesis GTPase MnmE [Candidatus Baltobacteraceae bacterium]
METIAAIATPPGKGAIAIVRVSGPQTAALAARVFRSRGPIAPRVATYGTIVDETGGAIDRGIALYYPAPHSYTGEDSLELQVHGSPVVAREVVRSLIACGARYAAPGEFTRRAFLNGKLDLHAAGAVADLIDAESRSAARAALANLGGGLAERVRALRAQIAGALEELAAAIDFPDEVPEPDAAQLLSRLEPVLAQLRALAREGEAGRLVREGIAVAIVGPPNAGKSSLLNALLGEDRALVSEIPGTTRDTIEESITVDGVQLRLVDTAGIRAHADRLESAGIERTHRVLRNARVALVVIDGSVPPSPEGDAVLTATAQRPRVVFINKADAGVASGHRGDVVGSVREKTAIEAVRRALADAVWNGDRPDLEHPHLASLRELQAVADAIAAMEHAVGTLRAGQPADLAAGDLQRAFGALGHLTGDAASEELLTAVFARFCIGK